MLSAHLAGREADLERARALGELLLARFEDPEKGGFAEHVSDLPPRPQWKEPPRPKEQPRVFRPTAGRR